MIFYDISGLLRTLLVNVNVDMDKLIGNIKSN